MLENRGETGTSAFFAGNVNIWTIMENNMNFPWKVKNKTASWAPVAHACNLSYLRGSDRGSRFEASLGKWFVRPHLQNNQDKMDWRYGGVAQVVECLLCKHEALS
jgi:hypothetical protein